MTYITMSPDQTATYDGGDERATREMMAEMTAQAQRLADTTGTTVEAYTDDGIVVAAVDPQG